MLSLDGFPTKLHGDPPVCSARTKAFLGPHAHPYREDAMTRKFAVRALRAAALIALSAAALPMPARATVVLGSFTASIVEVRQRPFPISFDDPVSGSFVYDTALAINSSTDPFRGDYTLPAGAALSVTVDGLTFSTSSSGSPLLARVIAPTFPLGDSLFQLASSGGTPDPSNPLPNIVPRLSLLGSSSGIPFTTGALPTSDFLIPIGNFSDPDGFLTFGSTGSDIVRFHLTALSLVAVPEPATAAMLCLGLLAIGAIRGRRSGNRAG
jgi:hypothetical protein